MAGGETTLIKVGPAGSDTKSTSSNSIAWDEKGHTKISKIFISYDNESISSLQFKYIEDGKPVLSPVYGQQQHNARKFATAKLQSESEYITGLIGHETNCGGLKAIYKMMIITNKKKYGPYATAFVDADMDFPDFSFRFGPDNQFGGFYGTFSDTKSNDPKSTKLTSIGVYVKA